MYACSRLRRRRVQRRSWRAVARSPPSDRSGSPAPVTFSNSQPFQSRPNPPPAAFPLPFHESQTRVPDAVLASSDPPSGPRCIAAGNGLLWEEARRGPFGPDILGMICSSPPSSLTNSFRPCLRNRAAAACILWTRPAMRAGLGRAVGSAFALTKADQFAI